jgi:hypothetical protein
MDNRNTRLLLGIGIAFILIVGLIAIACLFVSYIYPNFFAEPTRSEDIVYTQAAETISAMLTQTAVAGTGLFTNEPPSATPTSTSPSTQPPTATSTSIPPTATPVPPTPTPTPLPCNWVKFVKDVTIPDGSVFPPNAVFTKTWRLKNIGLCTWTRDYMLVFDSGERMEGAKAVQIGKNADPGESVDLSVDLIAPQKDGTYRGYWKLSTPDGQIFGMGDTAKKPFWVEIKVIKSEEYVYDFALNYCDAKWTNVDGQLPCPGKRGDKDGFTILVTDPLIEIERLENEPALMTVPQEVNDGYIRGVYPEVRVKDGYRFKAVVGCLDDSDKCDVVFRLSVKTGEADTLVIWEAREVYDGNITHVDLDLSAWAGQEVKFILTVHANGSPDEDNAFWLSPRIED